MIGTSLNQYQITASIGAGGMGEVFRARDTRLNRDVAVKVLPKDFVADADRLRRFEQEAKTLAALNHPNVLTIHDAGVHEGAPYLVSELLEGRTLRGEMNGGALPLRKATDYAVQIAHGLAAAHSKGVIHRDLKPENIFVTRDGRVKILDFGLAKLRDPSPALQAPSPLGGERDGVRGAEADPSSPTLINSTQPGMVLGTPAYMAPEQVRGEPADHRADIFAFGCVLYEILSGTRAFRRNTPVESMNAVLNDAPPELRTTHPNIPLGLAHIVERCLEKQPDNRFQSAKDLAFAIEAAWDKGQPAPGGSQRDTSMNSRQRQVVFGIALLAFCAAGVGWWFVHQSGSATKPIARPWSNSPTSPATPGAAPASDQKSIAVLPFVNMSSDKENEYLSDGITEEILNVLAKVPGLRVPGRSSSFAYKGKTEEGIFRKVGEQLHVATVLEGSVRKAGDQLRITAQLINVADGFHLWSETYDRNMTNIFAIQDDIARSIVTKLKLTLAGLAGLSSAKHHTGNVEAYELYLKGKFHADKLTETEVTQAITHFQEALTRQPNYALAYTGLAYAYGHLRYWAYVAPGSVTPQWRAATAKALELDDTLAEAHYSLARLSFLVDRDWGAAEREFKRALELDPANVEAHRVYAYLLAVTGRHPEALAEATQAQQLDPLSVVAKVAVGNISASAGDYDRALEVGRQAIAMAPDFFEAHRVTGTALWRKGQREEGIAEVEKAAQLAPAPEVLGSLGRMYGRLGRKADAQKLLAQFLALAKQRYFPAMEIARVYDGLGDIEQANVWMNKAIADREAAVVYIKFTADDRTRANPYYSEWLKKIGLDK